PTASIGGCRGASARSAPTASAAARIAPGSGSSSRSTAASSRWRRCRSWPRTDSSIAASWRRPCWTSGSIPTSQIRPGTDPMATAFTLRELGDNVTAGDVVRVLVSPGDTIAKDQAVLELETDKATIEVPSSVAGAVKDIKVKKGDRIKVGQTVLTVDD